MTATLDDLREFYAEEVKVTANLKSPALVRALAAVPREEYLGPGPWQIQLFDWSMMGTGGAQRYLQTPDADPRHVYHNVAIAIDPARALNNGHPGTLAAWIDQLDLAPGCRALHVGCGTGYYTAVIAEMTGGAGRVVAHEIDPQLAARARANLARYPHVEVIQDDARDVREGSFDAIMINAGVTHPQRTWLDGLADRGRMLLPLTFEPAPGIAGKGGVFRIVRQGDRYAARFSAMVQVFSCVGSRDPGLNTRIQQTFMRGTWAGVRSLRLDPHAPEDTCWLHGDGWCLSTIET